MLRVTALLTSLLPLVSLAVMVQSSLEGDPLSALLGGAGCYLSARCALILLRLSTPPSASQP